MTPNRKTVKRITQRALRKCTQFYADGVHAWCTPAEHVVLCWYFGDEPWDLQHSLARIKKGECRPGNHYIHVKKWNDVFPVNQYACLDTRMTQPYKGQGY